MLFTNKRGVRQAIEYNMKVYTTTPKFFSTGTGDMLCGVEAFVSTQQSMGIPSGHDQTLDMITAKSTVGTKNVKVYNVGDLLSPWIYNEMNKVEGTLYKTKAEIYLQIYYIDADPLYSISPRETKSHLIYTGEIREHNPTNESEKEYNFQICDIQDTLRESALVGSVSSKKQYDTQIEDIIQFITDRLAANPYGKDTLQSWNTDWTEANSPSAFESTVIALWQGAKLGQTYSYDMALAILFLLEVRKKFTVDSTVITRLATTLKSVLVSGADPVPFSYIIYSDSTKELSGSFTGTSAWVALALAKYGQEFGDTAFISSADVIMSAMHTNYKTDFTLGTLYSGGLGHTWYSTEHNIDVWNTYNYLFGITGDTAYKLKRDSVKNGIMNYTWNETKGTFNKGKDDTVDALDCSTWGAAFLVNINDKTKALRALAYAESHNKCTGTLNTALMGYNRGEEDYTGNHIWSEGTAGKLFANLACGSTAENDFYYTELASMKTSDGGYLYCSDTYEILDDSMLRAPSVSGTVWFGLTLLADKINTTDILWVPETLEYKESGDPEYSYFKKCRAFGDGTLNTVNVPYGFSKWLRLTEGKILILQSDKPADVAYMDLHTTPAYVLMDFSNLPANYDLTKIILIGGRYVGIPETKTRMLLCENFTAHNNEKIPTDTYTINSSDTSATSAKEFWSSAFYTLSFAGHPIELAKNVTYDIGVTPLINTLSFNNVKLKTDPALYDKMYFEFMESIKTPMTFLQEQVYSVCNAYPVLKQDGKLYLYKQEQPTALSLATALEIRNENTVNIPMKKSDYSNITNHINISSTYDATTKKYLRDDRWIGKESYKKYGKLLPKNAENISILGANTLNGLTYSEIIAVGSLVANTVFYNFSKYTTNINVVIPYSDAFNASGIQINVGDFVRFSNSNVIEWKGSNAGVRGISPDDTLLSVYVLCLLDTDTWSDYLPTFESNEAIMTTAGVASNITVSEIVTKTFLNELSGSTHSLGRAYFEHTEWFNQQGRSY